MHAGRGRSLVQRGAVADRRACGLWRRGAGDRGARACRGARPPDRARSMKPASIFADLDGIAAAAGPGLIGGVIVGLTTAKALALVHDKPLIAVNHLEAHALTARLTDDVAFPYCLLLASGGHTQIVAVRGVGEYVALGTTMDDAIGEAFDKTAKLLGPRLSRRPAGRADGEGRRSARASRCRARCAGRREPDFSLSGLKTALRLEAERDRAARPTDVADLCASFQPAIVEDLVRDRLRSACACSASATASRRALVVAGGVAANEAIRQVLQSLAHDAGIAPRRAAARALHRQRRDDRLGRRRAAGGSASTDRSTSRPAPAGRSKRWPDRRRNRTPAAELIASWRRNAFRGHRRWQLGHRARQRRRARRPRRQCSGPATPQAAADMHRTRDSPRLPGVAQSATRIAITRGSRRPPRRPMRCSWWFPRRRCARWSRRASRPSSRLARR